MDEDKKSKSFMEQISSSFFRGLLIIVPPAITIFIVVWLFDLTEGLITKVFPSHVPGTGLVIVLLSIWIIGVLSGNFLSEKILAFFDGFGHCQHLKRQHVISLIWHEYDALKCRIRFKQGFRYLLDRSVNKFHDWNFAD